MINNIKIKLIMVTFYVKVVAVIIIYIYSTEIFVNCILTGMLKKNNPN